MPKAKGEVKTICFNYIRDKELCNIKFRAKNKDFKLSKDAELLFYNLDAIKGEKEAYICEGEIDCMSLHECGVYNSISVPNGASVNGNVKLEYLDNCWNYFTDKDKVILVVDNDAAGNKLQDELARRIGYGKCFLVKYPSGCKDANDVLVKHGKDVLKAVIDAAYPYPLQGELTMDDMYETVCDFYLNGYPKGFDTDFSSEFNELITFYPGQLTVITGIPGSGKSEYIDLIMTSLSRKHGWKWGVTSFECSPEFHVTKLAEKFTNKAFAFRKDIDHRMNQSEFEESIGLIDKHFKFMNLSLVDVIF